LVITEGVWNKTKRDPDDLISRAGRLSWSTLGVAPPPFPPILSGRIRKPLGRAIDARFSTGRLLDLILTSWPITTSQVRAAFRPHHFYTHLLPFMNCKILDGEANQLHRSLVAVQENSSIYTFSHKTHPDLVSVNIHNLNYINIVSTPQINEFHCYLPYIQFHLPQTDLPHDMSREITAKSLWMIPLRARWLI